MGIVYRLYYGYCENISSKLHGKAIRGGELKKVALLGFLKPQVRSGVVPKVRQLAVSAAVPVLETLVPALVQWILAMVVTPVMVVTSAMVATPAMVVLVLKKIK